MTSVASSFFGLCGVFGKRLTTPDHRHMMSLAEWSAVANTFASTTPAVPSGATSSDDGALSADRTLSAQRTLSAPRTLSAEAAAREDVDIPASGSAPGRHKPAADVLRSGTAGPQGRADHDDLRVRAEPRRKRRAESGRCAVALVPVTDFLQKSGQKDAWPASVIWAESSAAERKRHAYYTETI